MVEEFNYKDYFRNVLQPKSTLDIYNRFIFSFCSVHTTWENNIRGYLLLKDQYHKNEIRLKSLIKRSGIGLYNNRTRFILTFTEEFLKSPRWYLKFKHESWIEYAERLNANILGLGFAKIRFAIEMIYPLNAQVVCTDTHIIQWAGLNPDKITKKQLYDIEQKFITYSENKGLTPVEARAKYWDKKQGHKNPRYWMSVFETPVQKEFYDG